MFGPERNTHLQVDSKQNVDNGGSLKRGLRFLDYNQANGPRTRLRTLKTKSMAIKLAMCWRLSACVAESLLS